MSLGASAAYLIVMFLLTDFNGVTIVNISWFSKIRDNKSELYPQTMSLISLGAHVGSYQFMQMMGKPKLSDTGAVLDCGTDLNMEGGIAE